MGWTIVSAISPNRLKARGFDIAREANVMGIPRVFFILSLLAAICPAGEAGADPSLVGIWYSAFQPDEPNVMSLIEFDQDGTFHEEFRKCMDGDVIGYQTQSGTWSVADGKEHTLTTLMNNRRTEVEDVYVIESLSETEHRVRLDPQGYVFVEFRVEKFEFPDCPSSA
jgi:hypothetical protein